VRERHANTEPGFPRIFPGSLRFVPRVCVLFCPQSDLADNLFSLLFPKLRMVLPVGIEPTTSPLPRECSTTELRQHPCPEIAPAPTKANTRGSKGWQDRRAQPSTQLVFRTPSPEVGFTPRVYHVGRKRLCCLLTRGKIRKSNHELLDRFVTLSLHRSMSQPPHITPKKSAERAAREARLAKALRENLVRRKEQKRAQEQRAVAQSHTPEPGREPPG
jgi:hypothetical protein